jgi:hypothetical protein
MANNYAQFSEQMVVPEDKIHAVAGFLMELEELYESGAVDWYGGIEYTFPNCAIPLKEGDKTTIWLHSDDTYMDEELIYLVKGLLEAIDSDEPFIVNVAYTCSKPRVGEFSGGCYAIWRDKDYYVDPYSAVMDYIKFHSEDKE